MARLVQHGQPLLAAAVPCERDPEGRPHVDLTLGLPRRAGQDLPSSQLDDCSLDVAAVAQDDSDRIVRQ